MQDAIKDSPLLKEATLLADCPDRSQRALKQQDVIHIVYGNISLNSYHSRRSHGKDIKLTITTQLWPIYDPIMTWSGISRPPLDSCQGGRVQHLVVNRVIITYCHHESETEPFLYSSFMIINSIISFDVFYGQTQPWQRKWTFSELLPLWFEAKITARNLPIKMVQSTKSRIWSSW